jgi:S-adenosylmethionine hydrolase
VARPVLTLLTDFGPDAAAAICRGVILGIAPDAQVVDISHSVAKYEVRDGAFLLWCALPWMPVGFHVAIVDPGVGTARRPIAIRVGRGDILLGPDNGLLAPAARRLGGVAEARALTESRLWLDRVSGTFHGRDIFSPVAAHLATGTPFEQVGQPVSQADLVDLVIPSPSIRDGGLDSSVVYIDSFGNARLAGDQTDLAAAVGPLDPRRPLRVAISGDRYAPIELTVRWARTFGDVPAGSPLLYEDSFGRLALADNQGDIARRLGLARDRTVRIEPGPG